MLQHLVPQESNTLKSSTSKCSRKLITSLHPPPSPSPPSPQLKKATAAKSSAKWIVSFFRQMDLIYKQVFRAEAQMCNTVKKNVILPKLAHLLILQW